MVVPSDRIDRLRRDWQRARSDLIAWAFSSDLNDPFAAERGRNIVRRVVMTHEALSDALSFRHAARYLANH